MCFAQSLFPICADQLQGIVSEVTAILRQPEMIRVIKNRGLGLYTYGEEK